ncbi:MAG: TnsD family transposase [Pyrinomonadaceae bacterium MAG19_C2-C3]|nr:TnsD family transposase [Pyrinomonadaceae bacterium MAG19_C2-C3]
MIGFFPEPYPDELFYSLCARYRRRAHYCGRIATVRDLFGSTGFRAVVDLPSRLDHLVAALPPGHNFTAERFIDEHTLLPFYAAFLSPARLAVVRSEMRQSARRAVARSCAGVTRFRIRLEYLRYCPTCVADDRERCGEAYWHRVHQASGVHLCPAHGIPAQPSGVHATYRADREEFVTLEEYLRTAQTLAHAHPHRDDHIREFHLAIARDARWLLDQRGLCAAPGALRRRYLNLLYDHGLATSADLVRWRALRGEVEKHYRRDYLASLNCRLAGHARPFEHLLKGEGHGASHPVHHLLLIHYLGCSARDFFVLSTEQRKPFGDPPFPCLNPASEHYRELRVQEYVVKDVKTNVKDPERKPPRRRPVGEFVCGCGFVYRRIGPDTTEADRYRTGWVTGFGSVWESTLRALRRDGDVHTNEEVARRLGVCSRTLRAQEQRLGLRPRKCDDGSEAFAVPTLHHREQSRLEQQEKRRTYREQWMCAIQADPQADLLTLKVQLPAAHNWLRKNDDGWMRAHTPRRCNKPKTVGIDWQARDIELSAAVRRSAARLMNAPGRPVRVSAEVIARDTGQRYKVLSRDERLPLTNRALIEVAESSEAWAIRRIKRAVECYRSEGVCATRWEVLARASVNIKFGARQEIAAIVEESVRSLRPLL